MALDFSIADQAFSAIDSAGQTLSMVLATGQNLVSMNEILGLGFAVEVVFVLLAMITESGQAAFQKFMRGTLFVCLFAGIINNWGTLMAPYPMQLSDELVAAVSGGQSPAGLGASLADGFSQAVGSMISVISPSQQPLPSPKAPGGSQSLWQMLSGWWDTNPVSSVFVGIADSIVGSAFTLIDVLLLAATFAMIYGSILIANVTIYIALAVGPFLFALSGIRFFGSVWKNWLSLIMSAIMIKPILALLVSFSLLLLKMIENIAATSPSAQTPQALIMVLVFVLLLVMWQMVSRAQSITSQLFGGLSDNLSGIADQARGIAGRAGDAGKSIQDTTSNAVKAAKSVSSPGSMAANGVPKL